MATVWPKTLNDAIGKDFEAEIENKFLTCLGSSSITSFSSFFSLSFSAKVLSKISDSIKVNF